MTPQYPILQPNVTLRGYHPKLPITELMKIYDELTALGLYVIPRKSGGKVPMWKYWHVNAPEIRERVEVLQDVKRDDVDGWCVVTGLRSSRLVVLDFDTAEITKNGVDPVTIYNVVQEMSPTAFVLASPSGGVHLYYRLPETLEMIGNLHPPVRGIDVRGQGGQVNTLGCHVRYDNQPDNLVADKKGVPDGHLGSYVKLDGGMYDFIPEMTEKLYQWVITEKQRGKPTTDHIQGENYGKTPQGEARVQEHFRQPLGDRERIVLECLDVVLGQWDVEKSYEQWYQLWMSAHHGSNASSVVRDFILEHPNVYWRDGEKGREHFHRAWDSHTYKDGGFTVASLFWLARRSGWLSQTGYEIRDSLATKINTRYITKWLETLEELPKRLLLMSQTGSGKTFALAYVWERLGKPKTVIFVPSIKLATELANTLNQVHHIPALLYIDPTTGRALPTEELREAHVLVTTLQTFGMKVKADMAQYGLVYIEEADQLLIQFARGGGSLYGSHVSHEEAQAGYATLRQAFAKSAYVWAVDATMSKVTYDVAEAFRGEHSITVVKNLWVEPKAQVTFLTDKGEAYQVVLKALEQGKRVVVAADTAQVAEEVVETMTAVGALAGKTAITITRHSERNPAVQEFMENVNVGAAKYDLVAYNSCMASGVSITDVTPDVLVQICTYLTPRVNLQILNRYRKQVKVYCYYRPGENLYGRKAADILADAERRAWIESNIVSIPVATRTSDAELRAYITSMSVADEELQSRSAKDFYIALLRGDGRKVEHAEGEPVAKVLRHSLEAVRKAHKEQRELIAQTWQAVPPIDRDRPAPADYTPLQVAQGETHALIERALKGNIPTEVAPKEIYTTVMEFYGNIVPLSAFLDQERALKKAETYLADRGRAITSVSNMVTLIKVLSHIHLLYYGLDEELDDEKLEVRAPEFMRALTSDREAYNAVILRKRQDFDSVYAKYDNDSKRALAFAKIILARIGLHQRSERVGKDKMTYKITNAELARQFLLWRNQTPDIPFTMEGIQRQIDSRQEHIKIFREMTEEQRQRVMEMLMHEKYTDFPTAVLAVQAGEGF